MVYILALLRGRASGALVALLTQALSIISGPYPSFPFVLSEVGWRADSASSHAVEGWAAGKRVHLFRRTG